MSARQGNHGGPVTLLEESLAVCRELGDKRGMATNMETLACVAFGLQQPMWAVQLLGSADALREAVGTPRPLADQPEYGTLASTGARIGEHAFGAAWAKGRAMAPVEAITRTLDAVAQNSVG